MLFYVVGIDEGAGTPLNLYSQVESLSEKTALQSVVAGSVFDIILFNDFAMEIARSTGRYTGDFVWGDIHDRYVPPGPDLRGARADHLLNVAQAFLGREAQGSGRITVNLFQQGPTVQVFSGPGDRMTINGFDQATVVHEMLPQVIGDHAMLKFAHSPTVQVSPEKSREFSDCIIYDHQHILSIQAKSFNFEDGMAPVSWANAKKRMVKSLKKAISQTKGSSRLLSEGLAISAKGEVVDFSRVREVLFAIFVPDLDLITSELRAEFLQLSVALGGRGHSFLLLDPMQLLRTVQALGPYAIAKGCAPEKAFFDLLRTNSEQAKESGEYERAILYRW